MTPRALTAAVALVALTGCGGHGGGAGSGGTADADGKGGGRPTASTAPSAAHTTGAVPSPAASPTPPYPTGKAGCYDDRHWSTKDAIGWAKLEETMPDGSGPLAVRFTAIKPGYDGPLCRPLTLRVQFWKVTYAATGTSRTTTTAGTGGSGSGSAKSPDFYFTIRSMKLVTLHWDGRSPKSVPFPKGFFSSDRSPCVGGIAATYVGKPLTSRELPKTLTSGGGILASPDAVFRTSRIVDHQWSPPSSPQSCDERGRPVPGLASPTPTANGVPLT
jgi:hypothetical protein